MSKLNWAIRASAVVLQCATAAITLPAQTFTSLFSFDSTEGAGPFSALVQATDGNLYGTTGYGGVGTGCETVGCGTAFVITPRGALTNLYNFCSESGCTDGDFAFAGLVQATDGSFYGATLFGGTNGDGLVFKINPSGILTTLHSFEGTDGTYPVGLVQASDGDFYGTTGLGGANGDGTVFKITPNGALTTLHSFDGTDGDYPQAPLIQGTDGNFYGTTYLGGANAYGTIFKMIPGGTLTTLYSFCSQGPNCTDGARPGSALVQGADGNFYGTSISYGPNGGGTVFKITPSGTLTTLYGFCSQSLCADGEYPTGGLVQATDGNFYGNTAYGGTGCSGCGTVFKVTPSGALTTLYSFHGKDGKYPTAAPVQDTSGRLYGTTVYGGSSTACSGGCGTVFSLSVGLGPFVKTLPTTGKVGASVKILGTNLTGTTSVSFDGTAAVFTVVSSSLITTTVPTGATSGKIQVVIGNVLLSSNVPFRVAQ